MFLIKLRPFLFPSEELCPLCISLINEYGKLVSFLLFLYEALVALVSQIQSFSSWVCVMYSDPTVSSYKNMHMYLPYNVVIKVSNMWRWLLAYIKTAKANLPAFVFAGRSMYQFQPFRVCVLITKVESLCTPYSKETSRIWLQSGLEMERMGHNKYLSQSLLPWSWRKTALPHVNWKDSNNVRTTGDMTYVWGDSDLDLGLSVFFTVVSWLDWSKYAPWGVTARAVEEPLPLSIS